MSERQWAKVGAAGPDFALRSARGDVLTLSHMRGQPAVLAFAEAWTIAADHEAEIDQIRGELRGLGAVLLVVSKSGVFWFRPDDDFERFESADGVLHEDVYAAARRYGALAENGALIPSLFVLDAMHVVRFARAVGTNEGELVATLAGALSVAGKAMHETAMPDMTPAKAGGISRREILVSSLAFGFAIALLEACGGRQRPAVGGGLPVAEPVEGEIPITLNVNGADHPLRIDARTTLLDALRERLFLTGSKKGCDMGQCGACTVLVDGRRINACLALAVMQQGAKITTIEGLASGETLHPMQAAFLAEDGFQCGYCTSGQILSAVALLAENRARTDAEVREHMSGNLCRCGAYPNIVAAIARARQGA